MQHSRIALGLDRPAGGLCVRRHFRPRLRVSSATAETQPSLPTEPTPGAAPAAAPDPVPPTRSGPRHSAESTI